MDIMKMIAIMVNWILSYRAHAAVPASPEPPSALKPRERIRSATCIEWTDSEYI